MGVVSVCASGSGQRGGGLLDVKIGLVADLEGEEVVAENSLSGLGDAQPKVGGIIEGYTEVPLRVDQ